MKRFSMPTKIYSGPDSLDRLTRFNNKRIWVVCDAFLASGDLFTLLKSKLEGNTVSSYTEITPDPDIQTVVSGIKALVDFKPDIVIGFGGGSAIDAAKAMVFFGHHFNFDVESCIAIPTTSGTGSEVTNVTVISDNEKGVKYPIFKTSIYPDMAILDPAFTLTVPANITANTGMDVLTHALEAYVSINATDFSNALAEKSIHIVFRYLEKAYKNGDQIQPREKMHNASTLAGMAFSQAGLGLNHAIAHQLGGQFHVPHGLANAILLPHVIRFNAKHSAQARRRYARIARHCRLCAVEASEDAAVNQLINRIKNLSKSVGIAPSLRTLKITRKQLLESMDVMTNAAINDATMPTTPFAADETQIKKILEALL